MAHSDCLFGSFARHICDGDGMTPSKDLREILARADAGLCCSKDAKTLRRFIEEKDALIFRLTWEVVNGINGNFLKCKHCGRPEEKGHADYCQAKEVPLDAGKKI